MRIPIPSVLTEDHLMAILRGYSLDGALEVADALQIGGVRCIEVTLNRSDAFETIQALRHEFADDLVVGAGTVVDVVGAMAALDAQAEFVVAPNTDPKVIGVVTERGVPCVPGAMTPSEILTAWSAQASAVKIFPAAVLGPEFIRNLRGPLEQIPLIAVGGIDGSNASDFLAAGCAAVGVGTWLAGTSGDEVESSKIKKRARQLLDDLRSMR